MGVVRNLPSVSGSWNCGLAGGACVPRPAKSGVSRSAAMNWTRGYKTYRNGVTVGFVPPSDRLKVREVSTRYLSQDERIAIADLRQSR